MANLKKLIDIDALTSYNSKIKQEYVSNTKLTSKLAEKADTTALSDYVQRDTADSTYAKKDEVARVGDIKGTCEQSELEGKKGSASQGDCWVVTDQDNHIFYYNGTDFIDCGAGVDLTPYAKSSDLTQYAKSTDLGKYTETSQLETTIDGYGFIKSEDLDDSYLKSDSLSTASEEDINGLFE